MWAWKITLALCERSVRVRFESLQNQLREAGERNSGKQQPAIPKGKLSPRVVFVCCAYNPVRTSAGGPFPNHNVWKSDRRQTASRRYRKSATPGPSRKIRGSLPGVWPPRISSGRRPPAAVTAYPAARVTLSPSCTPDWAPPRQKTRIGMPFAAEPRTDDCWTQEKACKMGSSSPPVFELRRNGRDVLRSS